MSAGERDRNITVEAPTVTRDSSTGAPVTTWAQLGNPMWAQVIESATASDEGMANGVATYAKPTRIRALYRSDINETQRVNLGGGRLLAIIGVAMMGRREGIELACKEWAHE